MSTKAIRDALDLLQEECGGVAEIDASYVEATRELEAIEKAAKRASATPWLRQLRMHPDTCEDAALVEAIAKEAP